ncbi:zinc metalloproteinase nas-13-like isoform X1 [Ictalurus furcatus]|uniref:zinc metalloproteinase nas-13-like isoform X1 n=1 Tax=Ictalurus furcatus TaxID=66913 RepID=UPI0023505904|nr:zinc metalloproteinase nas-13-like isoform X1 [Ictalurus furcatus]
MEQDETRYVSLHYDLRYENNIQVNTQNLPNYYSPIAVEDPLAERSVGELIERANTNICMEHNFNKIATLNQGTPYDYNSVMQYHRTAFSKNGLPTMIPIPNANVSFGQATQMSQNDIARLNRLNFRSISWWSLSKNITERGLSINNNNNNNKIHDFTQTGLISFFL